MSHLRSNIEASVMGHFFFLRDLMDNINAACYLEQPELVEQDLFGAEVLWCFQQCVLKGTRY